MIETLKARLEGVSPLLMHNGQLADPMNEYARAMKVISSKRNKSDEDIEALRRAEWEGGLYLDDHNHPAIPSDMLIAVIIEGARKSKEGKDAASACFETQEWYPLSYSGPKSLSKLYAEPGFVDSRGVRVQRNRVIRNRPRFADWSCDVSVSVDSEIINPERICQALEVGGHRIGLGDFRPRYGRFTVGWL